MENLRFDTRLRHRLNDRATAGWLLARHQLIDERWRPWSSRRPRVAEAVPEFVELDLNPVIVTPRRRARR
jgi:hypothetical protein